MLFLLWLYCSYDPLVNPLEKNLKLIMRVTFVALAKWEMKFLPICINRGLAAAAAHCVLLENKRDKV